ncbi:MAG: phosphate ABC transporter substrate-binding protein [Planctomycetes bacterium]|nr:phosphate ABC transporter substrate-binding protein [Planctomycetota bacterium]
MKTLTLTFLALALATPVVTAQLAETESKVESKAASLVDARLPEFTPNASQLSGSLYAVGSDTMINLITLWGEKFKTYYPEVSVQIEGKGSSTAPPALIEGVSQLGPMSRKMKSKEKDAFVENFGYEPTLVRTCLDALAVFVNKDNPIAESGLTLDQVDAIFSKTRKRGFENDIVKWSQLAVDGDWANAPISIYGRNSASGTYGFFKKHALMKGDYRDTVKEQPGSASVVQSITADRFAIGYSGIGYLTSGVKAVPLSVDGEEFFDANLGNVVEGDYPLGRFLNVYINFCPNTEMDDLRGEFFRFIFSKEGQEIVLKAGYLPITSDVAATELGNLGLPYVPAKLEDNPPLN